MIDFEWYRSFIYIYKYNSVSEAAKTRIMTQPAMSQHLAALEAEVGELLFIRTARKMVPTERGKELYSQLAPLVESLEAATLSFRSASLPTLSIIRIGSAIENFYEIILNQLQEIQTCTVSYFGTADELLELLKEGTVDIIVTSKKNPVPGIEYITLFEEEFVIVAPKELEIEEGTNYELKEKWLSSQNWISYGLDLPIIRRFWREHFKKRPIMKPIHVIPNLHLILKAIENGSGISLLPTYLLENSMDEAKSKIIFEDLKVNNKLFIAYQTKNKHLPEINDFTQTIRKKQ
ncbi:MULTISPECIES: LysR family transcriptional regulator [unclassified Bacillus (in: firmicutes)]|uniref:LysR family transcriptional regulator n=1 Tax=unclassified Bacillus (in: firmicutes) TaxID=185979 RepID=UPI001BE8B56D|nr:MULTISPECIES: LysR family transcriptional regulator [unclassified Bacillus (in: firmicutes)]MBT2616323.1 LysR family transcriptional regulator [Bacillus sp. ISL-78]MBT2632325.1 LysR family transcriptional regulator [Bacillus sp. ISL-101]